MNPETTKCPYCNGAGETWLDTGWHRGHATGHMLHCTRCHGTGKAPVLVRIGEEIARKALAELDASATERGPLPIVAAAN